MQPAPSWLALLSVSWGTLCSGRSVAAPGSGARAPWRRCLGAAEASLADLLPSPPSAPSARVRGQALSRPFRSLGLFIELTRPVGSGRSVRALIRAEDLGGPDRRSRLGEAGGGGRQYLPRYAGRGESGPSLPIAGGLAAQAPGPSGPAGPVRAAVRGCGLLLGAGPCQGQSGRPCARTRRGGAAGARVRP